MSLNPLNLIEKLINEHGSSSILRERLELIRDQLAALKEKNEELDAALTAAIVDNERLRRQIPDRKFVEFGGVKFKRKPSGGFEQTAYCPSCEVGMATIPGEDLPFTCGRCHALSGFTENQLSSKISEMQAEYS